MATVKINALNPSEAEKRAKVLQDIENTLTTQQIESLGKISKSPKAKGYLTGSGFMMLKTFLGL